MMEDMATTDPLRERSAGTALVGVDPQRGRILRASRQLATLLATTTEELEGSVFCDHVHPVDRPRVLDAMAEVIRGPSHAYEGRGRLVDADGGEHRVTLHASLVIAGERPVVLVRVAALHR
jgi:PAS domain S-box-containing protein